MNKYTGFSDLCIPEANTAALKPIIAEAIELGYRNVAIEQTFDASNPAVINKKQDVPKPYNLKELRDNFGGQIRLLNRLTVVFEDASVSLVLNKSTNVRGYDLIAALPTREASLQYACQTLACDIITYNQNAQWIKLHRKFYYLAVERNIAFEIKYAPAIVDSTERKATITRAHRYHFYGKSKNVLISSGAKNAFELRSPYDIANLGLIFGLSEEQSKRAVRDVPNKILLAAEGRRFGKAGVILRKRKENDMDSDDYSGSELEEEISDVEEDSVTDAVDAMDVTAIDNDEEVDDLVDMQPPKKMKKKADAQK
uniref:Uncharacterized protein n=1 Tax=Anopheles atroparvus TaxID=41427 RepID=A0A182JDM2_ANOAO